jgi:hypothetical protein
MAIDTLAYVKTLEAAGVDRRAAEAHAEALTGHVLPDVATKADIDQLRQAMRADIHQLRQATRADLEQMKHELTVRVFGLVLGIVGAMNAVLFALLRAVR